MTNMQTLSFDDVTDEEMFASFTLTSMQNDPRITAQSQRLLARLPSGIKDEFIKILNSPMREKKFACPAIWRPKTIQFHLQVLVHVCATWSNITPGPASVSDLLAADGLERLKSMTHATWSLITLRSQLRSLRALHRVLHGFCPSAVCDLIKQTASARRRNVWELVRSPEDYKRGAKWLVAHARQMKERGHERRARTMLRDATILAVTAEICLRRGEMHWSDAGMLVIRDSERGGMTMFVSAEHSKAKSEMVLEIRDPRVDELVRQMLGKRTSGPLFVTNKAKRLSYHDVYRALSRASERSIGVRTSFNIVRRSGVNATAGLSAKKQLLRHRASSRMVERTYHQPNIAASLSLARHALLAF